MAGVVRTKLKNPCKAPGRSPEHSNLLHFPQGLLDQLATPANGRTLYFRASFFCSEMVWGYLGVEEGEDCFV